MKEYSIKISQYIEFKKPNYIFLKLIPSNSIRNYNSDKLLSLIAGLYRAIDKQIRTINKKLFFECNAKVSYYIYMEKKSVQFYFIVPETHYNMFKDKIIDVWQNKITITKVPELPVFDKECTKYFMTYKKEDALSLNCDKRDNILLNSILTTIHVMEEGDKVGVLYNFAPVYQKSWRVKYDKTLQKLKQDMPVNKNKLDVFYIIRTILLEFAYGIDKILQSKKTIEQKALVDLRLSSDTLKKRDSTIVKTQILCFSQSADKNREYNNGVSICQSFQCLDGDNAITYRKYKNERFNILDTKIKGAETMKIQTIEGQSFISLPGRELLEEHKIIEHTNVLESEVPVELQNGVMHIGENNYKGKTTKSYLTTDQEYRFLTLVIIGPTRAGKTKLIGNLAKNGVDNGECNIIFDFCGNAELSSEIASVIPGKILNIDCSDFNNLQGLGYNEVIEGKNTFEQYRNAKMQTSQLVSLINSINSNDTDLRSRMERYLEAAANVVFIQSGSIRDVFMILQDHLLRHKYIDNIPDSQKGNLEEYISALYELDDINKNGEITGTKFSYIQGILNRVNKLKSNTYLELMLKKDCKNNINLVNEMQKSQLICLKMPDAMFATETEKDIYCTYWLTKIWLALQVRKSMYPTKEIFDANAIKVNLFIDELYQVPQAQEFLRSKLSQIAKFAAKPIISCHYLGQIPIIRDELKAANSSYMLIAGCDKGNYKELGSELYPYMEEDLLNLERYHSLNLLRYENGWVKFITKLPKPL